MTADELMQGARIARDAALLDQRVAFQRRFGLFAKCNRCGAELPWRNLGHVHAQGDVGPCGGRVHGSSYTAPESVLAFVREAEEAEAADV